MKKLIQTRLHNPPEQNGNCFATVIACILDLESSEDVLQIQEYFDWDSGWQERLDTWLFYNGWIMSQINDHLYDGSFYLVTGESPRDPSVNHICIYRNGTLYHDPHPDQTGIVNELIFETLTKM